MFKVISLLVSLSLFINISSLSAETLALPKGKVILTITGNIDKTNIDDTAQFDLKMLLALKQELINTTTPWTQGVNTFEGPTVSDLMNHVGAKGTEVSATALNGYRINIPILDTQNFPVIVALKRNDEVLSIRKKGPGWVIYPWDDYEELRNNSYYTRSIWQLKNLEFK